jgi:hypothetical protein|tara:strand:+ start:774 stop:929 length:156 start_codon:yes stop_codon:yes gene_type:complete
MDFPKVKEYFHFHEDCWNARFKTGSRNMPRSMEDIFGTFHEPKKETPAEVS